MIGATRILVGATALVMTAAAAAEPAAAEPATAEPALGVVELRVAGGLTSGGGQGGATMRAAPAYVGIYGGVAVASAPWTWLRGGVFLETGDREAVGLHLGPRIARGAWVFGAGASALVAPYTLYGPTAHVGLRLPVGGAALVPGAELVAFAGGSDLPAGKVVTELLLAVGVEIDAW